MDNYLEKLWDLAEAKMGALAGLAPTIAANVKISLKEGDVGMVRVRATELRECAAAQDRLGVALLDAVADGSVDLAEGADVALALEKVLDEAEDVIRGYDEDKEPEAPAG